MSEAELTEILKAMYENAPYEKSRMKILFGIQYAAELKGCNIEKIAENADGKRSAATEIRKGIQLEKYVEINFAGKNYIARINGILAKKR